MKCCLLVAAVVSIPLLAADKPVCPWMNAATAAGILEGAVEMTVSTPSTCEFVRQKPFVSSLRIEVATGLPTPDKCSSNATLLKAIGNEAVACAEDGKDGLRIERVSGRVRDQHFIIRVSTTDASWAQASLFEEARRAAEQVAGNLF